MKLSVSNIAWNEDEADAALDLLARLGVDGIEIAPTKIWPDWNGASPKAARAVRDELNGRGFQTPALQAILFGRPNLKVFGSAQSQMALLDHIEEVAAIADAMGAKVLVFGSPKNRDPGELGEDDAFEKGAAFFRRVGDRCAPYDVNLCLEPNPTQYDCRFMTSWRDIVRMVDLVGHPNVAIHLDAACIALEGDDPVEAVRQCAGAICHFHATEANLGGFSNPQMPHEALGVALREGDYENWVSIEMRRSETPLRRIETAVQYVKKTYGGA